MGVCWKLIPVFKMRESENVPTSGSVNNWWIRSVKVQYYSWCCGNDLETAFRSKSYLNKIARRHLRRYIDSVFWRHACVLQETQASDHSIWKSLLRPCHVCPLFYIFAVGIAWYHYGHYWAGLIAVAGSQDIEALRLQAEPHGSMQLQYCWSQGWDPATRSDCVQGAERADIQSIYMYYWQNYHCALESTLDFYVNTHFYGRSGILRIRMSSKGKKEDITMSYNKTNVWNSLMQRFLFFKSIWY